MGLAESWRPEDLYRIILDELNKGKPVAVVTVVEKIGSGPRAPGAKMIVTSEGGVYGTIGGGLFERDVIENALEALSEGKPRMLKYAFRRDNVTSDSIPTGLECGGSLRVFIDVVKPTPRLVIVGAGHVGKALGDLANAMGLPVVVVDVDGKLASKERFPYAEEVVVARSHAEGLEKAGIRRTDLVVIVYGGVESDYEALIKALELKPRYVGLMASRRRVMLYLKKIREEGVEVDDSGIIVSAPVGIDIGGQTPSEIAVSILAEIVAVLNDRDLGELKRLSLWEKHRSKLKPVPQGL